MKKHRLEDFELELIGNKDEAYRGCDPEKADYYIAEEIIESSYLSVSDLHYPTFDKLEEYKKVKKHFYERCPKLHDLIFKKDIPEEDEFTKGGWWFTPEQIVNRKIHRKNPTYRVVFKGKRETVWLREWVDDGNEPQRDWVVFNSRTKTPKPIDFRQTGHAFRFNNEEGAIIFVKSRNKLKEDETQK